MNLINKHWNRLKRSLSRRWREWMLPGSFVRLGTKYGGWWLDQKGLPSDPLLIDCGLGEDISFPQGFLQRFGGKVIGIEPNPRSLAYCREHCPKGMDILVHAFWSKPGESITFHLPRAQTDLPKGADGVSGSLIGSHPYVTGGELIDVSTIDLAQALRNAQREHCDVLKLDIEGAEYEVILSLVESGEISRVGQLLVEFHHGATHHTLSDTENAVRLLASSGMTLRHVESRNYIFGRVPE